MAVRLRTLVSGVVLLVSGGLCLGIAPAAVLPAAGAATCTTSGGVSVVVDFRELGGTTITACAADGGGKSATAIFNSVGVNLSYATRQPGFVCRVNGAPASEPCVNASPANAYWGLWWADGSRASWSYSSSSAGGLTIPAGGSVAWSWQQDRTAGTNVPPEVAPPVTQSSPTSSPTPTSSPSATPTSGGGTSQPSPTASPTASPTGGGSNGSTGGKGSNGSGTPTANPTSGSASPTKSPSASESATNPTDDPTLAPESPSDSTPGDGTSDGPLASESPSDSTPSGDASEGTLGLESPSDSSASGDPDVGAEGEATADEPTRIPAALTWSIVALLGIGIAVSAVVARRRRVSDAS